MSDSTGEIEDPEALTDMIMLSTLPDARSGPIFKETSYIRRLPPDSVYDLILSENGMCYIIEN